MILLAHLEGVMSRLGKAIPHLPTPAFGADRMITDQGFEMIASLNNHIESCERTEGAMNLNTTLANRAGECIQHMAIQVGPLCYGIRPQLPAGWKNFSETEDGNAWKNLQVPNELTYQLYYRECRVPRKRARLVPEESPREELGLPYFETKELRDAYSESSFLPTKREEPPQVPAFKSLPRML